MTQRRRPSVRASLAIGALSLLSFGCRSASVQTTSSLPLRRVVIYRNGVGYFERQGHVDEGEVRFRVAQREVGDFLATLAVMERGGSSVRAAAFPTGRVARSAVGHMAAILRRTAPAAVEIWVFRSMAATAVTEIGEAMARVAARG
jgi:hypothetical protein